MQIVMFLTLLFIILMASNVFAKVATKKTIKELAKTAENPIAKVVTFTFQNNTNFNFGLEDKTQNILNVQSVIPFSLTKDWAVITRTIIPVMSQPGFTSAQDRTTGIGDTAFSAFLSPKHTGKMVWGVGPVFLLPTATRNRLGADKWGIGPTAVFLTKPGNWVVGTLFSNIWSAAGHGNHDVSLFTLQYFINYILKEGWYLTSSPFITANWKADSGNKWTIPFGGGVGKVFRIGKNAFNMQFGAYYNAERPDNKPDWQVRFQLQFLFPK